jgi:hypothetical protein
MKQNKYNDYNKYGMVTECSFIKLTVGGNGTDDLASDKVNLGIAFDVTRCKVQIPERIGLAVLLINLTGSAELVNVRQTLCRVSDRSNIPNGILLDVNNFLYAVYAFPILVLQLIYRLTGAFPNCCLEICSLCVSA